MIYVDGLIAHPPPKDPRARRAGAPHGHRWCHLFSDDPSPTGRAELHALAASIGLKRSWFQDDGALPHYDLTPPRRAAAIAAGAAEADRYKVVACIRGFREHARQEAARKAGP